ncbi:MAG: hypothetical protein GYB68_18380 [Chloroflexi bacterium]|nr:hypothetical protein [Chloroflexota bacterium]
MRIKRLVGVVALVIAAQVMASCVVVTDDLQVVDELAALPTLTPILSPTAVLVTATVPVIETPTPAVTPLPPATVTQPPSLLVTPSPVIANPTDCSNDAVFVSDVTIPDGTVVTAGEPFTKTWRMRNTGTCTWGPGYTFDFLSDDPMSHNGPVEIPLTEPEQTVDLSITFVAPLEDGDYKSRWQLLSPTGDSFGQVPFVEVVVGEGETANPETSTGGGDQPGSCATGDPVLDQLLAPSEGSYAGSSTFIQACSYHRWRFESGGNITVTIRLLCNGTVCPSTLRFELFADGSAEPLFSSANTTLQNINNVDTLIVQSDVALPAGPAFYIDVFTNGATDYFIEVSGEGL